MSQHDSTPPAGAGTPSSPYGGPRTGLSGRGTRFFDWMRGLGLVRSDGWIGGVCAGIADRLGIDPIIVRGIVVVAAVLGAPALLLYAAAWALLPDRENRIHLQRLLDGEFQPAIVGIGAMALVSLLPMTQGLWWAGPNFWGEPSWGDAVGRVIWTLVVIGLVVGLVIAVTRGNWAREAQSGRPGGGARAAGGTGATAAGTGATPTGATATDAVYVANASTVTAPDAAAGAADTASTPTEGVSGTGSDASRSPDDGTGGSAATDISAGDGTGTDATDATPTLDTSAEPTEPPAPAVGASTADVASWQARHVSWQAEHAQWKQRLNADMRAVKQQRSAEMRAQSAAMAAEAAARRRAYRAANPRAGASFGWAAVGVALVAAALTQSLWQSTALPEFSLTAAFAVATGVFGVSVLIAGLARRRSGFLIFLGILLAVVTVVSGLIPRDRQVVFDGASISVDGSTSLAQPYGHTDLDFASDLTSTRGTPVVDLQKGVGTTTAWVPTDVTVRVEAVLHGGSLFVTDDDQGTSRAHTCTPDRGGICTIEVTVGPNDGADTPDSVLRVDQTGELSVNIQNQGEGQ
ncbi:PspC domain-containing protein [Leifsonia sp. NPDC058292]|uniref:PspC domain-containing protein n=1 Tax=Leifsonia sp. NPDC058292 TaxID=3346428 RepID=UPI0036D81F70